MKKALWLALLLPVFSSWGGIPLNVKGNIYYLPATSAPTRSIRR